MCSHRIRYVFIETMVSPPYFLRDTFNRKIFRPTLKHSIRFACLLEDRVVIGKRAFTSSSQHVIQYCSIATKCLVVI